MEFGWLIAVDYTVALLELEYLVGDGVEERIGESFYISSFRPISLVSIPRPT